MQELGILGHASLGKFRCSEIASEAILGSKQQLEYFFSIVIADQQLEKSLQVLSVTITFHVNWQLQIFRYYTCRYTEIH